MLGQIVLLLSSSCSGLMMMQVAEPPTLKMNEMLRQLNTVVTGGGVCIRMAAYGAARAGHPAACPSSPTIPTIIPGTPSSPLWHVQKGIFILCSDWTHIMLVTPAIIQCDNRNLLVPMCVNAERFNGVCYNYNVCNSRRMATEGACHFEQHHTMCTVLLPVTSTWLQADERGLCCTDRSCVLRGQPVVSACMLLCSWFVKHTKYEQHCSINLANIWQ